tara:strand:+ start:209 stop:397 length:189 start_codon:yes stop_codon:yes gene_type:complete
MIAYCDKVMHTIGASLREDEYFPTVGSTFLDLHEDGSFKSTKKIKYVTDFNGKQYKITVEEV